MRMDNSELMMQRWFMIHEGKLNSRLRPWQQLGVDRSKSIISSFKISQEWEPVQITETWVTEATLQHINITSNMMQLRYNNCNYNSNKLSKMQPEQTRQTTKHQGRATLRNRPVGNRFASETIAVGRIWLKFLEITHHIYLQKGE